MILICFAQGELQVEPLLVLLLKNWLPPPFRYLSLRSCCLSSDRNRSAAVPSNLLFHVRPPAVDRREASKSCEV